MNAFLSVDGKKRLRMTEGRRNLLNFWRLLDEFLTKIFSSLPAHHVQGRGALECGGEENTSCQGG